MELEHKFLTASTLCLKFLPNTPLHGGYSNHNEPQSFRFVHH